MVVLNKSIIKLVNNLLLKS